MNKIKPRMYKVLGYIILRKVSDLFYYRGLFYKVLDCLFAVNKYMCGCCDMNVFFYYRR